jgi:hypothetical protein
VRSSKKRAVSGGGAGAARSGGITTGDSVSLEQAAKHSKESRNPETLRLAQNDFTLSSLISMNIVIL